MAPQEMDKSTPSPVLRYLNAQETALSRRRIWRLGLTPLMLVVDIAEFLRRRTRIFCECRLQQTDFGCRAQVARKLKPAGKHSDGRTVEGAFDILVISERLCVLASALDPDAHYYGPRLLADYAYPLAKRPFLTSIGLCRLLGAMATKNDWEATALDAMGYDRQTLQFRRDMKRQAVDEAFAEMSQQRRQVHQVKTSFHDGSMPEALTASFNRYAEAIVYRGAVGAAFRDFLLPAVGEVCSQSMAYDVQQMPRPSAQEMVQLVFADEVFSGHDDMKELGKAVQKGEGLSVTAIHLNPYLQAQVLDFFTGAAVELLVMDDRTISLIPRLGDCRSALGRIAETVFYYFGEAEVRRGKLVAV